LNPFFAEHLLEFAPDAFLLIDTEGRIHYANRAVQALLGYRSEDLTGLKVEHLLPQRLRGNHQWVRSAYTLHPAACGKRPSTGRLRGLRRDGTEVDVEISLTPVHFDGQLHTAVVVREVMQPVRDLSSLASTSDTLSLLRSITEQLQSKSTDTELQILVARQQAALALLSEQLSVSRS
jgi:PAS domain S-box-containing protein